MEVKKNKAWYKDKELLNLIPMFILILLGLIGFLNAYFIKPDSIEWKNASIALTIYLTLIAIDYIAFLGGGLAAVPFLVGGWCGVISIIS